MLVVSEVDVVAKSVLVRADLEGELASPRLLATKQIVEYLKAHGVERVKVLGHEGSIGLVDFLNCDVNWDLRADGREKENSKELAEELGQGFDVYVNEAFATSHRRHASIDALPRWMKSQGKQVCLGLRFAQELTTLRKVQTTDSSKKVLVLGGTKVVDKDAYATDLEAQGWTVLRGGLLTGSPLRSDGLDISAEAIAEFKHTIAQAELIVAAGVMGKYEDASAEQGTKEILTAIAHSPAYKVAGGGDIEAAISKYHLSQKFDWISVGGGAMLEYLAKQSLPGLEALG